MTAVARSGSGYISPENLPTGWVTVHDWKYGEFWHGPHIESDPDLVRIEVWGATLSFLAVDTEVTRSLLDEVNA